MDDSSAIVREANRITRRDKVQRTRRVWGRVRRRFDRPGGRREYNRLAAKFLGDNSGAYHMGAKRFEGTSVL